MAVLGAQLIITIVMLSFLHKFSVRYSLARWLLTQLRRYLHPNNEKIRQSAGLPPASKTHNKGHQNSRKRRETSQNKDDNVFTVPRNAPIELAAEKVTRFDLLPLHYYPEYQWLLDFALCALIVFFLTEIYRFFFPNVHEFNLSLIWCILVLVFCCKSLLSLTALYFKGGDEAIGERSVCIVSACMFFLIAMVVLIADENFLEFGLNSAYASFNESAYRLLEAHGMVETATGPTSKLMFKFWLAVWCGAVGAFFAFPGLRFAQMHKDSLIYSKGKPRIQVFLHLAFVSPLFVTLLWIKPLTRRYLTERTWGHRGILMSPEVFDITRIAVIILIAMLRVAMMPKYLQAYLNLAPRKLDRLRKEAGRISNVDLQKMVAHVYYYLCVVSLQYVGPALMCLFSALLLKTLGEYKWTSFSVADSISVSPVVHGSSKFNMQLLKDIFNPTLFRGLLGFMTWWMSTVWFATSVVGFVYHTYFST